MHGIHVDIAAIACAVVLAMLVVVMVGGKRLVQIKRAEATSLRGVLDAEMERVATLSMAVDEERETAANQLAALNNELSRARRDNEELQTRIGLLEVHAVSDQETITEQSLRLQCADMDWTQELVNRVKLELRSVRREADENYARVQSMRDEMGKLYTQWQAEVRERNQRIEELTARVKELEIRPPPRQTKCVGCQHRLVCGMNG